MNSLSLPQSMKILEQISEQTLSQMLQQMIPAGADDADLYLQHSISESVSLEEGRVKHVFASTHQGREVNWKIAARPSKRKMMPKCTKQLAMEKEKSSVQAKVEHPFYWIKCFFGYSKVRYRGLDKNKNRLYMLLGLTNLLRSQKLLDTG